MRERLRTLSENEKNKQLVSFPSFLWSLLVMGHLYFRSFLGQYICFYVCVIVIFSDLSICLQMALCN
jgi:uncharacterized membrane protein